MSPLLRKSFDQSWFRWKEKEKEMIVLREREREREVEERERRRIFGGDVGDGDDDGVLCEEMLGVVRFLFGGEVDFGYLDC